MIQRATKQEFKDMVELWKSKEHEHAVNVTVEALGLTLLVPMYGQEEVLYSYQ